MTGVQTCALPISTDRETSSSGTKTEKSDGSVNIWDITPEQVLEAVDDKTVLVSIMAVNNEIGSILPIGAISRQLRRKYPHPLLENGQLYTVPPKPAWLGW